MVSLLFYLKLKLVAVFFLVALASASPHESYNLYSTPYYEDCVPTKTPVPHYCVRKCCAIDYYVGPNATCVHHDLDVFKVSVYRQNVSVQQVSQLTYGASNYAIVSGIMGCINTSIRYRLDSASYEDEFFLQEDGRLWLPLWSSMNYFEYDKYCLDYFEDMSRVSALVCMSEDNALGRRLNTVGMMISMPFLLATFLVHALLPEKTLHGGSLMCYVAALFWTYFLLVYLHFKASVLGDAACLSAATFCIFFFVASFFWMNVISFDMWWTFSGVSRLRSADRRTGERRRFLLYSAYAWSAPLLLVALLLAISYGSFPDRWFNPGLGRQGQCWFQSKLTELLYLYGPVALLILSNIVLFAKTYLSINKVRQAGAGLRKHAGSRRRYEENVRNFELYLKLMLAMGVNWITEVISWLVLWLVESAPSGLWYLSDFCNALYGVFIFFVFVFKKSVWTGLKRRYYQLKGKPFHAQSLRSSSSANASSSRTNSRNAAGSSGPPTNEVSL